MHACGQRAALGVGPCPPSCVRQGLFTTVDVRLAGPQDSGNDCPVSTSHHAIATLGLQTCATVAGLNRFWDSRLRISCL